MGTKAESVGQGWTMVAMNAGPKSLNLIPLDVGLSVEGFWQRQTQNLFC